MTAQDIIRALNLAPHPEGGWFRQTWVGAPLPGGRPSGTAILFFLSQGDVSHWHRFDADELWFHHAGAPVLLRQAPTAQGPVSQTVLGPDLTAGQAPQALVAAHQWQTASPLGGWALVSCTTNPGFLFDRFELAPPDFDIPS